ncbi:MAG: ComEA family DNA-binding protein [Dehalococcoidia bacterium]
MLDRYRSPIIIALAGLLAAAVVALVIQRQDEPKGVEITLADLTPTPGGAIEVYVTGAVTQPGVYQMRDGDRVIDVLYEAGGHAADADLESVNLALRLHDEDQVLVPRVGQALVSSGATSGVAGVVNAKIDINSANAQELDVLPGIGEVYSERIVASRLSDGPYVTAEELVERRIIPNSTLEQIRTLIIVGQ